MSPPVRVVRTLPVMTHRFPDHHVDPRPAPRAAPRGGARASLTAPLNAEWDELVWDPRTRAELAEAPIAGHTDLGALLLACGPHRAADQEASDAVLARVVAAGLEGRTLAVRVALQRVLGPIVAITMRRTPGRRAERRVVFDELCATAWLVIATYPLARRPRRIAANICRDVEYLTFVRPYRLHQSARRADLRDEDSPAVGLRGSVHQHPADELAELLDGLQGGAVTSDDLALLDALASGQPLGTIAAELGCTDRTIRNRRHRLVGRLRELAAP